MFCDALGFAMFGICSNNINHVVASFFHWQFEPQEKGNKRWIHLLFVHLKGRGTCGATSWKRSKFKRTGIYVGGPTTSAYILGLPHTWLPMYLCGKKKKKKKPLTNCLNSLFDAMNKILQPDLLIHLYSCLPWDDLNHDALPCEHIIHGMWPGSHLHYYPSPDVVGCPHKFHSQSTKCLLHFLQLLVCFWAGL